MVDGAKAKGRVTYDPAALAQFCRRWMIKRLDLFGSILRDDFRANSDIDVLVSFAEDARWTLFDRVRMRDELSELLARSVDLVSRRAIERSANWIRRAEILDTAEIWYAA
jgi:hypothetical protein